MGTPSGRRGFYPFAAAGSLCDGMTEIMSINTEKALADPEAVFAAPEDLATSIALTRGQRIAALDRWAFTVRARIDALSEGMTSHPEGAYDRDVELARLISRLTQALREA